MSRSVGEGQLHCSRPWAWLGHHGAMQVGFNRRGDVAEALAVDLQVLHNALDVVARFGERNALNPINSINLGIARIAVLGHPLLDPPAARIAWTAISQGP